MYAVRSTGQEIGRGRQMPNFREVSDGYERSSQRRSWCAMLRVGSSNGGFDANSVIRRGRSNMAIPRLKSSSGPAFLSYGFRPFFLAGASYAGLAILIWLPIFFGHMSIPTALSPVDWHVHEMLYGFLPAVITGFLLTAIPNWTGQLPLQGSRLAVLVVLWLAGRIATFFFGTYWTCAGGCYRLLVPAPDRIGDLA